MNLVKDWAAVVNYMDDEIREQIHRELAPCTNEKFLERYFEICPEFEEFVIGEFGEVEQ